MILELGGNLTEIDEQEAMQPGKRAVFITTSREAGELLKKIGMVFDGEINLKNIGFNKIESQQECLMGTLFIPKLLDVLGSRYKIQFFINEKYIIIVDDDTFSIRLIKRIIWRKSNQGTTKELFLYNYLSEIINRDLEILVEYERTLMEMEEDISHDKISDFQENIMPIRRKLLTLRSYYDEMADMGKELHENENGFFAKKQLKYFGTIIDRADRLMGKTTHLLEYAGQVRDAYQSRVDARQNRNMQFLTVISTIFFPLTLITGWYGMNFNNMPELNGGYPAVIMLSIAVVVICISIFKIKKIF